MTKYTRDYDVTDEHSDSTYHQELSAAETIDKEDRWEGEQEIDHSENTSSK